MASFKLYLDTRSQRKDGTFPLKIAINHRKTFLINLKVYTIPEHFIGGEILIPGNSARQKNLNNYIKARMSFVENTLNKLRVLGQLGNIADADLKKMLDTETAIIEEEEGPALLSNHWRRFVDAKKPNGQSIYNQTESKLRAYCNFDSLQFIDITVVWLKDFDKWMSETCEINTRSIHMRNIRAVFNDAIDEDVIDQNTYPFRKFKIKTQKTKKRSLSLGDLKLLKDYEVLPHQERYRDIFMLIFYLIGINMVDLVHLTEIKDDRIEFDRQKTGRPYSIRVEPEALAIFEKYKGSNYLLNILDAYEDYKDFLKKINVNLKQIGPHQIVPRKNGRPGKIEYNGLFPDISTYWARHTWATIAASLDIPKETIAAALGHGGNTVTDIYIDFDRRKVDEANRKVIDQLFL